MHLASLHNRTHRTEYFFIRNFVLQYQPDFWWTVPENLHSDANFSTSASIGYQYNRNIRGAVKSCYRLQYRIRKLTNISKRPNIYILLNHFITMVIDEVTFGLIVIARRTTKQITWDGWSKNTKYPTQIIPSSLLFVGSESIASRYWSGNIVIHKC